MKKYVLILSTLLSLSVSSFAANKGELRVGGTYLSPTGDFWKSGEGANIQYRYRVHPNFALAASLGIQKMEIDTQELDALPLIYDDSLEDFGFVYMGGITDYEGDAVLYPAGISAILSIPIGKAALSFETGLKYVFINSKVKANMLDGIYDTWYNDVMTADSWQDEVEIDDSLLGLVGAQLDIPIATMAKVYIGCSYQFDLTKGDVTLKSSYPAYNGIVTEENDLTGLAAETGIAIEL